MAPVFLLMGKPESVAYYEQLKKELETRVNNGIFALSEEKYRVMWDGFLPWAFLGKFSRRLVSHGINPIIGRYPWELFPHPETIEPEPDPVHSFVQQVYRYGGLAKSHMPEMAERELEKLIQEYSIDGIIMYNSKTCRIWDIGRYDMMRKIQKTYDIPGVVIEGDMIDPDCISDEQIGTRIEVLCEMMQQRKY